MPDPSDLGRMAQHFAEIDPDDQRPPAWLGWGLILLGLLVLAGVIVGGVTLATLAREALL